MLHVVPSLPRWKRPFCCLPSFVSVPLTAMIPRRRIPSRVSYNWRLRQKRPTEQCFPSTSRHCPRETAGFYPRAVRKMALCWLFSRKIHDGREMCSALRRSANSIVVFSFSGKVPDNSPTAGWPACPGLSDLFLPVFLHVGVLLLLMKKRASIFCATHT